MTCDLSRPSQLTQQSTPIWASTNLFNTPLPIRKAQMLIFDSVFYHLPASLSPQRRAELSTVLDANGGQEVELRRSKLTHVVTNTNRFEGWEGVKERETVKVVTVRFRSFFRTYSSILIELVCVFFIGSMG